MNNRDKLFYETWKNENLMPFWIETQALKLL